ncbi:Sna4p PWA37_001674 [Arxiozyma heterogenica]|uniref:Sna4p n=1 Tax=Arxiozyma heterogenica TaxID=278026 RepID=UPI002EDD53D1
MCCVICSMSDCILYIVAVIFPPIAVLLRSGFCSSDLLLNILLTMLGFFPGLVHAFYYITITSPLRRQTEYVYVIQQGIADIERNDRNNSRGYGSYETMQAPLISSNKSSNNVSMISEIPPNQESQNGDACSNKQIAPPPYSEIS